MVLLSGTLTPRSPDSFFSSSVFCKTLLKDGFEVLGTVDLAEQVAELVAGLEQLFERLDLFDDPARFKILDAVEFQTDGHVRAVVLESVFHFQVQGRRHAAHDLVEIVPVDLHELAVLQRFERHGGVAGKVAEDTDNEGKLLLDHGSFGLDLVLDVDPGLAHPFEFVVDALGHLVLLVSGGNQWTIYTF